MIQSAIAGNIELIEANTVQKQIVFAVSGFVIMIIVAMVDYRLLAASAGHLFWYGNLIGRAQFCRWSLIWFGPLVCLAPF